MKRVASFLLGVILFAQGALALAACGWVQREPARAVASMDDLICCAEGGMASDLSTNANLCLAHCTSDAQRVDNFSTPSVPTLPPAAVLAAAEPLRERLDNLNWGRPIAYGFAAPSLLILFQNFRI